MPLLTAGTINLVRQLRVKTLTHVYTWVQRTGTTTDSEGGTVPAWAVDVLSKPCHLLPMSVVRVDPSGAPLDVQAPRLVVPWDDPIKDGDAVEDITATNTDGVVIMLLTGPALVQQIVQQNAADAPTHKVCTLTFEIPKVQTAVPS